MPPKVRIRITDLPDLGVTHIKVGQAVLLVIETAPFREAAQAYLESARRLQP